MPRSSISIGPRATRGAIVGPEGGKPKLARGGMREPHRTRDANGWFARAMLTREPGQKYTVKAPLSFPVAHRTNADHRFVTHDRHANFEYDMKRRPVDPVPQYVTVPLHENPL